MSSPAWTLVYPAKPFTFMRTYQQVVLEQVAPRVGGIALEPLGTERAVLSKYLHAPRIRALARQARNLHVEQSFLPDLLVARPKASVATIWDLCNALHPELYPSTLVEKLDGALQVRGARRAGAIVTISQFQREELARRLPFPEDRIFVAWLAIDHRIYTPGSLKEREEARAAVRARHGIAEDEAMLISLSGWQPRKNILAILRTVRMLLDRGRKVRLLLQRLTSRPAWTNPILRGIEELRLEPHLAWLPPFDDALRIQHLRAVDALLFPTYYEGFGLPPLEAMACGCPVVASNVSTMPEVVGDAGVLVAPDDVSAMAGGVMRILDDDAFRAELARKGGARARRFRWEDGIRPHVAAYESALSR